MAIGFWLAQAVGAFAALLMLHAFWRHTNEGLRARMTLASGLWAVHFALLGAPVAAAMAVVGAARTFAASRLETASLRTRAWMAAGFTLASGVGAWLLWDGWLGLAPALLTIEMTLAYFLCFGAGLRVAQLINSVGFIAYGSVIGAWPNVLMQGVLIVSNVRGLRGMVRAARPGRAPPLA